MRLRAKTSSESISPDQKPAGGVLEEGAGRRGLAWKLFAAWVVVPPLLLCAAELGLRLAGYGVSTQLFLPRKINGETVCVTNSAFYQQFYTKPFRTNPVEFSMPAVKPRGACRIFVLGSSEVLGGPVPDFSSWGILETMLRVGRHGEKIEIYCLAIPGADSHVMRAAAKTCTAFQPDILLVYMGNNEMNPLMRKALVWNWLPPEITLRIYRLGIALNDSRLGQFLRGVSSPEDIARHPAKSGELDPERVYRYYESNMNDICDFARVAGSQVMLCTVSSRLREWVPEKEHVADLDGEMAQRWDQAYNAGNTFARQGRHREALAAYSCAADINRMHADLAYRTACCHYALGEYANARENFVRARELDSRHCRAGSQINEILKKICGARARDGVHLVDAAQSLADASPCGIEGPELFLDHTHPTFEGNYVLARSILKAMAQVEPRLCAFPPPPTLEECQLRQALSAPDLRDQFALTMDGLLSMPNQPRDRLKHAMDELNEQIGTRAEEMRLEACRKALELDAENDRVRTRFVRLLIEKKETANALEEARTLARRLPFSWDAHRLLARLLAETGEKESAIAALRRALAVRPDDADAHIELGRLLREDHSEQALAAFRTSFRLRPGAAPQLEIARVLRGKGDPSGAIEAYRRCLKLEPDNPEAFEGLTLALCDADRFAEANLEMRNRRETTAGGKTETAAVSGRPSEDKVLETRTSVLRQLVRLLPQNGSNFCRFQDMLMKEAARLETVGDLPGAIESCRIAIPLNPNNSQPVQFMDKILSKSSPAERRETWEDVWKENPGISLAAVYCGAARAATGDVAGAKEAFGAAQSLAPEEWSQCVIAADALAAAGASDDAIAAYQRALALNPKLDYLQLRLDTVRRNAATGAAPPQTIALPSPSQ